MDEFDPQELYTWAQTQLHGGAPQDAVENWLKENTKFPNLYALQMASESNQDRAQYEQLVQQDIGEHPIRETANAMLQGLGFTGFDELTNAVGRLTGNEWLQRNARQQRVTANERRRFAPGANLAAEAAGGLMLPGLGTAKAAGEGGTITRTLGQWAIRGGAGGAATGAATGALASDPGHRMEGAGYGAAAGGILGVPLGIAGGLIGNWMARNTASRRMAQGLAETMGFEGPEQAGARIARGEARQMREQASTTLYQPLAQEHPSVRDAVLRSQVQKIGNDFPSVVPKTLRNRRPREVSFEQLQSIRSDLRERAFARDGSIRNDDAVEAYNKLTEQMNTYFGDRFSTANRIWERSHRLEENLNLGVSKWDSSLDEITRVSDEIKDPEFRQMFNRGRLSKWMSEISRGESARSHLLRLETDWDRRASFAELFPKGEQDPAFQQVMQLIRDEAPKEAINNVLGRIFVSGGVAVSGGIIGGIIGGRRGGGGN